MSFYRSEYARELRARILSHVTVNARGCWIFSTGNGGQSSNGYTRISVRGTKRATHRVMWMLTGNVIFPGEELDHECHNRACVNPEHLTPATRSQNAKNRRSHGFHHPRGTNGETEEEATEAATGATDAHPVR